MNISENMFLIMKEKGIKSIDLAKKLNVRSSVISTWKSRNTNPPSEYLLQICELLDISLYELLNVSGEFDKYKLSNFSNEELQLIEQYRSCSNEDKQFIIQLVERLNRC